MVREAVKVAVYLDLPEQADIAELCIASVREHMPSAEVWHLTTQDGPVLSADHCLRLDIKGTFPYRQAMVSAQMTGDVLFLDADVLVQADVSDVFERAFDLAVTTDMRPGADGIKYNGGVIFCRNPAYWLAIAEETKHIDFGKTPGDWEPVERARNLVAERFNPLVLPGEEYNYVPASAEDKRGKLIHYRGSRKQWMIPLKFSSLLNTPMETMIRQAEENLSRDLPMFMECPVNLNEALIVGGGPSLQYNLPNLRMRRDRGGIIFALNGTHDWLIDRGIVPDFHVMLDARQENVQFVRRPHKDVTYLIAAQCHPDVFNALNGYKVIVWLGCFDTREQENDLAKKFPNKPIMLVGGGATVGLKTMNLAYLAGFRKLHFYGFDSCYRGESNHAYPQPLNDKESRIEVIAAGKKFTCAPWMAKQAMEFQSQMRQLLDAGCQIYVHGDGLIPWIVQQHQGGDR